jgi:hypothetical protein
MREGHRIRIRSDRRDFALDFGRKQSMHGGHGPRACCGARAIASGVIVGRLGGGTCVTSID